MTVPRQKTPLGCLYNVIQRWMKEKSAVYRSTMFSVRSFLGTELHTCRSCYSRQTVAHSKIIHGYTSQSVCVMLGRQLNRNVYYRESSLMNYNCKKRSYGPHRPFVSYFFHVLLFVYISFLVSLAKQIRCSLIWTNFGFAAINCKDESRVYCPVIYG